MTLPPRVVPFPVASTYKIAADLVRLGTLPAHVDDPGPATPFRADDEAPAALARLLDALALHPEGVRSVDPDWESERSWEVAQAVATATPDPRWRAMRDAVAFPWLGVAVDRAGALQRVDAESPFPRLAAVARAALARLPAATRALDALRFAVAEDLVVLRRDHPGDGGRAAYLCVVAPSGWDPGARLGASFAALHTPIPHAHPLLRAAPAIVDAMVTRGPFVRYVWGLAASGALSHHPRLHPARPLTAAGARSAWLRVERQTTLPLPHVDAALFAIRVLSVPLAQALTTRERRSRFTAAIASMDEATAAYKGLGDPRVARAFQEAWG